MQNGLLVDFAGQLLKAPPVINAGQRITNGGQVHPFAEPPDVVPNPHGFQPQADVLRPREKLLVQTVLLSLKFHGEEPEAPILIVQGNEVIGSGFLRIPDDLRQFPQMHHFIAAAPVHLPEQEHRVGIAGCAVGVATGIADAVPVVADAEVKHLDSADKIQHMVQLPGERHEIVRRRELLNHTAGLQQRSELQLLRQILPVLGKHAVMGHGASAALRRFQHLRPERNGIAADARHPLVQPANTADPLIIVHIRHAGDGRHIQDIVEKRVVSHHGDVLRHPNPVPLKCSNERFRHTSVSTGDCLRKRHTAVGDCLPQLLSGSLPEVPVEYHVLRHRQSRLCHGIPKACQPVF